MSSSARGPAANARRSGDADPDTALENAERERVKRYLVQRFYTRFHMSIILSTSALSAMLMSWALLQGGVDAMWMRYPVAIAAAYFVFLCGIWVWLRYVGISQAQSPVSGLVDSGSNTGNVGNLSFPSGGGAGRALPDIAGGGGRFGGAGASGSWSAIADDDSTPVAAAMAQGSGTSGSSSGGGMSFGDLDGDGIVVIILAVALAASVFICSGYVIWFAPDILTEAAFGALLAGGLVRSARKHHAEGWVAGVVKRTWWAFGIVLVVSMVFSFYAAAHFPGAHTFKQAIAMALAT